MKYIGSKNRLAKDIAPIIQSYIDTTQSKHYLEPFVGGANMIDKIKCEHKYGSDIHPYLIALLKQVQSDTSVFPQTITEDEYIKVRDNKNGYIDWYVGLVGFCASYNGKWFGGYANNVKTKEGNIRNYTDEAIRNLIKQSKNLQNIIFSCCDFRQINQSIENFVIYCDIPYMNTTKYNTESFSYEEFYFWCKTMSKHNIVLVSEYNMPQEFVCIWQKDVKCTLDNHKVTNKIEKLFIYRG